MIGVCEVLVVLEAQVLQVLPLSGSAETVTPGESTLQRTRARDQALGPEAAVAERVQLNLEVAEMMDWNAFRVRPGA